MGEENQRLDERKLANIPKASLAEQKAFEPFTLPIGEDKRAFDTVPSSIMVPNPVLSIAGHHAGATLDFGEENSLRACDQQINLVDRAVIGHEFEVGPGDIVVLGWKSCVDKIQRLLFPREMRLRNGFPMFFRHLLAGKTPEITPRAPSAGMISTSGPVAKLPL